MAETRIDFANIDIREIFPWLHLFRGFRIALELKKIVLGALGMVLMCAGWWCLGGMLPAADTSMGAVPARRPVLGYTIENARRFPWEAPQPGEGETVLDPYRSPINGGYTASGWPTASGLVLEPVRILLFPVALLFQSTGSALVGLLMAIWALVVWALIGGAITRIAAVQVAREGRVGPLEALRFAGGRFVTYLSAPILPFIGVALILLFCLLGGLAARVPGVDIALAAVWFLPLAAGFVMAVALLGLAAGWPLLFAAISAEATESFDALSRAYSYVLGRPWHYLFYLAVAGLFGAILMVLATSVGYLLVALSQYAVAWGGSEPLLRQLYAFAPTAGGWREAFGPAGGEAMPTGTVRIAAILVGFWTTMVFLAVVGFAFSYFWSASTIIYFLLRRDVEDTEFAEIFAEEEEEEPFPTVTPALVTPSRPGSPVSALPIIEPPTPRS